jgi:hypothetical protein
LRLRITSASLSVKVASRKKVRRLFIESIVRVAFSWKEACGGCDVQYAQKLGDLSQAFSRVSDDVHSGREPVCRGLTRPTNLIGGTGDCFFALRELSVILGDAEQTTCYGIVEFLSGLAALPACFNRY